MLTMFRGLIFVCILLQISLTLFNSFNREHILTQWKDILCKDLNSLIIIIITNWLIIFPKNVNLLETQSIVYNSSTVYQ